MATLPLPALQLPLTATEDWLLVVISGNGAKVTVGAQSAIVAVELPTTTDAPSKCAPSAVATSSTRSALTLSVRPWLLSVCSLVWRTTPTMVPRVGTPMVRLTEVLTPTPTPTSEPEAPRICALPSGLRTPFSQDIFACELRVSAPSASPASLRARPLTDAEDTTLFCASLLCVAALRTPVRTVSKLPRPAATDALRTEVGALKSGGAVRGPVSAIGTPSPTPAASAVTCRP